MVASVAVSFLSVLTFASVGAKLTCESNVSEIRRLSDGGCMYILEKSASDYKDVDEAECRSLNNETNEWRLPTIKTKAKNEDVEKLLEATVRKHSWFWIGVVREAYDPKGNKTEWGDLTKWRWSLDNTTVAESLRNFTPIVRLDGDKAPLPEHCIFAEFKWGYNPREPTWHDAPCSKGWKATWGHIKPLLLCESAGVVTTSTSSTSTSTTTTTTSTTTTSTTTPTTTTTTTITMPAPTTTTPETTSTMPETTSTMPETTTTMPAPTTTMPATMTTTTTPKKMSPTSTSPQTPVGPKRWKPWQIGLAVLIVVDVVFMIAVAVIFICTGRPPKYKSLDDTPREQPGQSQRVESSLSQPSKPSVKKPKLKMKGKKKA